MPKIKILRIITRLNIGGPAIHTVLLTAYLNNEQFESHLVAGKIEDNEADMSYFAAQHDVTPIYVKKMSRELRFLQDWHAFIDIFRIIKKIKPDIVHTHTAKAGMLGRSAAILLRVPIIIHTFHGNVFREYFGKLKTCLFIFIERALAHFTTKIIAISQQQKNELIAYKIASEKKIAVINLGFQLDSVIPSTRDRNKFRSRYNIPADGVLIGIVGRLVPVKNHQLFLEIAHELLQKRDIYFAIIGDGELRESLEEEIKKRNIAHRVLITGFIEDLKPVYSDLDLVLLTSNNEGTPVAVIEAMACQKIVMSTKVGGVEDLIIHGVNGFIFPPKEKEGFVKEIANWLHHPEQYQNIGSEAYRSVIEKFSLETLINNIKALYEELRAKSEELRAKGEGRRG
ncbi:MAG: glycosyltransferase family 4 protein [Candidatus Cloacimonetes bacterium]|nr:glycosyltransferase family 4 protein [Candidatus Cloacimonadota bacterium]